MFIVNTHGSVVVQNAFASKITGQPTILTTFEIVSRKVTSSLVFRDRKPNENFHSIQEIVAMI